MSTSFSWKQAVLNQQLQPFCSWLNWINHTWRIVIRCTVYWLVTSFLLYYRYYCYYSIRTNLVKWQGTEAAAPKISYRWEACEFEITGGPWFTTPNALKLLFHHSDVWHWTNFARKLVGEPRGWKRRHAALSWKMEFTFAFFVHILPFIMAPRLWLWRYHCVSDGEWHKYCTYVQNVSSDLL